MSPDLAQAGSPLASVRIAGQLVMNRQFGFLFWGKAFGSIGVWAHNLIAAIVVYQATDSALAVGATTAAQFLPMLVLTPLSGKFSDQRGALGQILVGRVLCGLGSGGLAAWLAVAGVQPGAQTAVPVIVASLVVGLGFVAGAPSLLSAVPALVSPSQLPVAMALNSLPLTLARALGPALGAVLIATMSPAQGFAVASSSQVIFAALMIGLRWPERAKIPVGTDFSIRVTLSYVQNHRALFLALVGVAAVGVGSEPASSLAPSLADSIGASASLAGWLGSAFGIGAAVGVLIVIVTGHWIENPWQGTAGLGLIAASLVGAAVASTPPAALCSIAICGVGMTVSLTAYSTLVQEGAPDAYRGRIMALWLVCFGGSRPLAAAAGGILTDLVTLDVALLATAAVMVVACAALRPRAFTA